MASAVETFGRLDILVNNVGGTIWAKPFEHYEVEQIEAEVRRSLFPTCGAAMPRCRTCSNGQRRHRQRFVHRHPWRQPRALWRGQRRRQCADRVPGLRNRRRGIRVNATAPGGTEAPPGAFRATGRAERAGKGWYQQIVDQTLDSSLMNRYGSIDEQVGAILFLASDEASYITGVTLPVGAATSADGNLRQSFLPQQKQERQMPCEPLTYTRSSTMRASPLSLDGHGLVRPAADLRRL
jgi:dihydroxycyclohexadiene carboxylate dehydrogenase